MRVIILGAGLLGVSTAWFLRKQGVEVTVIDQELEVGQGASFANGGQISVSYAEPWANISNLKKMISWLGKEDSPLLFRPSSDWNQWLWGLKFIMECAPNRNKENIKKLMKISMFSRRKLQEIRGELDLNYNQLTKGILTFYSTEEGFKGGVEAAKFMSDFGCKREIKTSEECICLEPALKNSKIKIFGGDYTSTDESGDALLFTKELKKHCVKLGVEFILGTEVQNLIVENDKVLGVIVKNKGLNKKIFSDKVVVAMGAYSEKILSKCGVKTYIYPAKGYSATIPILDKSLINEISLTDNDRKTVITRIGDNIRVAGTAEFNGFDLNLNTKRCELLLKVAKDVLPFGLDYNNVDFWTSLRPSTPSNVPLIGRTKINNLFINSGHGTLGWTMAVGSGQILSDLILNKKTIIEDEIVC